MQAQVFPTQSIQERVADGLRSQITGGQLESGAALSEIALAEEFGVSRTPVREALKQLQTEGLVIIRPRVGTFVSAPTRLEINELFQMKEILEGAAARLFAARGEIPELEALRANVMRAEEAVAADDATAYALLVEEFHELIIRGAGNEKLAQHYRMMMNQLAYSRLVQTSLSKPGRLVESESEHHRVIEIISAKDGTTAERMMREHVRASQQALLDAMVFADEYNGRPGRDKKELQK
jgi:DNA-binding GntR family transcriptional regulator